MKHTIMIVATLALLVAGFAAAQQPAAPPTPLRAPDAPVLIVSSPIEYQVFQWRTRMSGFVRVAGTVGDGLLVEARVTSQSLAGPLKGAWISIPIDAAARSFFAELPVAAGGWYRVEVRALRGGQTASTGAVEHVGVGEVFVGAGQSNSTSYAEFKTQPQSGMVVSYDGIQWVIANDPQPGAQDITGAKAQKGSFWPSFGDAMYAHYKVPIGVAVTGHGGTGTNMWMPDAPIGLFKGTMVRVSQLGVGGFRALLWHQGESDFNTPSDTYTARMAIIIATSHQRAGWAFPWFVAKASYEGPLGRFSDQTAAGQKQLWDKGIALRGPDTDVLTGDYRDSTGTHFSLKGLKAHGETWAAAVEAYLDPLLAAQDKQAH